jgi:lysophospholipase L1-like esterase
MTRTTRVESWGIGEAAITVPLAVFEGVMTAKRRRRKLVYLTVAAIAVLIVLVPLAALLAFDVYLHHRVQYDAGVNVWGYRGPTVGRKKPGEVRIVVIGGSTAFGYGLRWNESWPYFAEQRINERFGGRPPVRVINLGVPTDSARTFTTTLKDYEFLDYDIVCFYEGYNDLGQDNHEFKSVTIPEVPHYIAWRYQSPIFRWTGYFPIFPLVLKEKAMAMLYRGDLNAAYAHDIVFRPSLATRTTARTLEAASAVGVAVERRFGRLSNVAAPLNDATESSCGNWAQYCGAIADAVEHTVTKNKTAVVITQPYLSDLHIDQQAALSAMMARRFSGNSRVRYENLGRAIDMRDTSLVYDRVHLVARGNQIIADHIAPVIAKLITDRPDAR